MKGFVAITDREWFEFLSQRPEIDEVNFWQPGGSTSFKALSAGQPFLFKLHAPDNRIVGGGYYTAFSRLPISLAWEAFGEKNGVASLDEMRERTAKYRRVPPDPHEDYTIGCIILSNPFFFDRPTQFPQPMDFSKNIVQGKTYDLTQGIGKELWEDVQLRLRGVRDRAVSIPGSPVYGDPVLVRQRLGQGAFRVLVTDTYQRRCAITGEKILPVLQAAHIWPVSKGGEHRIDNGLLLRSDVHTLFDKGYMTVTHRHEVHVSKKLRDEFHNGEYYRQFAGKEIWLPVQHENRPSRDFLERHAEEVFLR